MRMPFRCLIGMLIMYLIAANQIHAHEDAVKIAFSWFSVTGLLGPGPANFPSSYRYIGDGDYSTFRYTLNSQDAITREYFTWEDDDEEYADYSYDSSRSEKTNSAHKPGKHRRLFRFGHHE